LVWVPVGQHPCHLQTPWNQPAACHPGGACEQHGVAAIEGIVKLHYREMQGKWKYNGNNTLYKSTCDNLFWKEVSLIWQHKDDHFIRYKNICLQHPLQILENSW
jgi:hypothetical protein